MARDIVKIDPYQAACELPRFIELREQIGIFKPVAYVVGALTGRRLGREASQIESQLEHLTDLIDSFYGLLGERNWVLHDSLKLPLIEEMVEQGLTPEESERRLIEHYKDEENLRFYVMRVACRSDMAGRSELIERAEADYLAGRYDAVTLRLITVLDGFVNDFDKSQRCGLSARDPGEMVGFDCLGGHYLGLAHAVEVFRKSFHKRVDEEVYEVYRHGIVHGLVVNYNNDVVASKAWNYLFAVCDWADSFAKKKQAEEQPKKSLAESIRDLRDAKRVRRMLRSWKAHTDYPDENGCGPEPWGTTTRFLEAIRLGHVWHVAEILCWPGDSPNDYIEMAKEYVSQGFEGWSIERVDHPTVALADVLIRLMYQGQEWETRLHWTKVDDSGHPAAEFEEGRWVMAPVWQHLDNGNCRLR